MDKGKENGRNPEGEQPKKGRLDYMDYLQYVRNNWVVTLLVAAILQLYSTHRISRELDKEAKKA